MLTEINKDFYCSAGSFQADGKCIDAICAPSQMCNKLCRNYRRKYPTPEQFKEEYGVKYSDDSAVYVLLHGVKEWAIYDYGTAKRFNEKIEPVVCACTPFGVPENNWRPKG